MPEDTTPQDRVQAFVEAFRELRGNKPNQSLIQMISNRSGEAAYLYVSDLEALLARKVRNNTFIKRNKPDKP